jgi:hypothetical protein
MKGGESKAENVKYGIVREAAFIQSRVIRLGLLKVKRISWKVVDINRQRNRSPKIPRLFRFPDFATVFSRP